MAFWAIHLLPVKNQGLEDVFAVATGIFVHWHFVTILMQTVGWAESSRPTFTTRSLPVGLEDSAHPTRASYVFRRLYTSLARSKSCRSFSVRLAWPERATFSRIASSLASNCSSTSPVEGTLKATGRASSSSR